MRPRNDKTHGRNLAAARCVQGLTIRGPDGKTYSFTLRPLLAGEKD